MTICERCGAQVEKFVTVLDPIMGIASTVCIKCANKSTDDKFEKGGKSDNLN